MAASTTILIADRNSHVRMFLMREMMSFGYCVKLAGTGENVMTMADAPGSVDLLILDPDLPGLDTLSFLSTMRAKHPALPILLHTYRHHDEASILGDGEGLTVIEKTGDSVERIKEAVVKLLQPSAERQGESDAVI